ncbi:hypothetical protein [Bradyrhizobium sp.]|uniref:hypothetical protein n=1 Tax=Bradyrhizobium sp. TaxID=376 RepID=UPI002BF08E98|nr:hypothetical protein [Bradyrhizobium sp.]HMM92187.1 hypothetical protein [Bradyrhizobium sp.]
MTIFSEYGPLGNRVPLVNARGFALEQLVAIHSATMDMRWAMVELAWRSFTAMCALAQRQIKGQVKGQLKAWVRKARTPRAEERHGRHCCC